MKEFNWWIKISTDKPKCIYYFGAFNNYYEAERHKFGYIQDLIREGSQIINVQINPGRPEQLTIYINN